MALYIGINFMLWKSSLNLTLNEKQKIEVPTLKFCDSMIVWYAQSMTIELS